MFDRPPILVGLELGTAKVCAVVAELGRDAAPRVIGVGQAESHGVRKGEVVDAAAAEEDVRAALANAEQSADVEIRSVLLAAGGGHVQGFNNRGIHPIVSADREITPDDVEDVIKNAKAINIPPEHYVLHAIRQHYAVDGHEEVRDPVGMLGARLEIEMHVTHGRANRFQNALRVVRGLHLEVQDLVFGGLASSLAVLTPEQKELGALVLDLGAGTTDFTVYGRGVVRHTGVLAVGGDHVTQDLAYGLKVPQGRAEQLKIDHGRAGAEDAARGPVLRGQSENGLEEKPVHLGHLRRIMTLRLEETLELIREELEAVGVLHHVRGSLHLCGGGAKIPGLPELAARVFALPAVVAVNGGLPSLPTNLDVPEFATALGLVKYGAVQARRAAPNPHAGWRRYVPPPLLSLFAR
jgi:cell division protein FtsA